jgi:hypothetical protein
VLPLDMVDNSIGHLQTHFGPVFCYLDSPDRSPLPEARLHSSFAAATFIHLPTTSESTRIWLVSLSSGNWRQGAREHLACRPSSMCSAGCHRRSSLPVALRHQLAPSFSRLHERYPQRFVRTHKMIVGAPPFYVSQELISQPSRRNCSLMRCDP